MSNEIINILINSLIFIIFISFQNAGPLFLKRNIYKILGKYYSIRNVYRSISLNFHISFFSRIGAQVINYELRNEVKTIR